MEDLLLESNVHIVNQQGSPATFVSHSGSSHIDVTLATDPRAICDWMVNVGRDDHDHRLITFSWGDQAGRKAEDYRPFRYAERKADWQAFRRKLSTQLTILEDCLRSPSTRVRRG